jgi:hypothetical protein
MVLGLGLFLTAPIAVRAAQSQPAGQVPAVPQVDLKAVLADPAGAVGSRDRLAAMEESLHATSDTLEQASVELAMANWLLAVPAASPATRWIIGLPESGDLPRIHEHAEDAQRHLARARKLLGDKTSEDNDRRRELQTTASTLEAFAKLLAACSGKTDSPEYRQACADAAVGLASARESDKLQIAAAAVMWQSFAWSAAGDDKRALTTLPEALSKPERLPYDFVSRLLRCRILAQANEPAAAIALLLHIEPACEDWFPQLDKSAVDARRRLAAALQWKITQDWLTQLKTRSPEAARSVQTTLTAAQDVLAGKGRTNLAYHLETAIPVLIEAPAITPAASDPAPDSAPAQPKPKEP